MTEETNVQPEDERHETKRDILPVLFIGLGGTGMEVIARIRRRVLHAAWGPDGSERVETLADFPVAEFIHFDLDMSATQEGDKSANTDPLAEKVELSPQDRLVTKLDLNKYMQTEAHISKFRNIAEWFPTTVFKISDPTKGAGQNRAISRLYFYDIFSQIQTMIETKLHSLKAKAEKATEKQLDRLNLKIENDKIRIVVVGSVAGGTGSGSFLDMCWLAKTLGHKYNNAAVQLYLFTPSGYTDDPDRMGANGYAAFMELETCMLGSANYVGTWDKHVEYELDPTPCTEIYILETSNLSGESIKNVQHMYEMTADALFEDFANEDFANRKRMISVNKENYKADYYIPPMPDGFGDMTLTYYKGYSAFGQSMLDTKYTQEQDKEEYQYATAMLEAFFGVAAGASSGAQPTPEDRQYFIKDILSVEKKNFNDFPEFVSKEGKKYASLLGLTVDSALTDELLTTDQGKSMKGVIDNAITNIEASITADAVHIADWSENFRKHIEKIVRDAGIEHPTGQNWASLVAMRGPAVLEQKKVRCRDALFEMLDMDDKGLEYVVALVKMLQEEFEQLAVTLEVVSKRYRGLSDTMRDYQISKGLKSLTSASLSGLLHKPNLEEAKIWAAHTGNYLKSCLWFFLRSEAADNAAKVLRELAKALGTSGLDTQLGNVQYSGLLKEFEDGRQAVKAFCREISKTTETIEDSTTKSHPNYIFVQAIHPQHSKPDTVEMRRAAKRAFEKIKGSRELFDHLKGRKGREALLTLLLREARRIRVSQMKQEEREQDPLFTALKQMNASERLEVFERFMRRAMPWINAEFRDVKPKPEHFTCLIGVMNKDAWERDTEMLMLKEKCIPRGMDFNSQQVQFCTTGIPGRAVCYCELSAYPLNALKDMPTWRGKYRELVKQGKVIHTVLDSTRFVHPVVPTPKDLEQLAKDFQLFLQAVMLGVLTKNTEDKQFGAYQYDFGADLRDLGNEHEFRRDGLANFLPEDYTHAITQAVQKALSGLEPVQLLALARLAEYTANVTYCPPLISTSGATTKVQRKSFPHTVALNLAAELKEFVEDNPDVGESELQRLVWCLENVPIESWTTTIKDSYLDARPHEVRLSQKKEDRCKRRVNKDFFSVEWWGKQCSSREETRSPEQKTVAQSLNGPWWFGIDGQKVGPCDDKRVHELMEHGKVGTETKAWKKGMGPWELAGSLQDLASLFEDGPPPLDEDGPPPL